MADKHIFIGLGGAGVNVVSLLKYKIYSRTSATALQSRLEVMGGDYRFMFVDTDKRDVERYNELYRSMYEGGRDKFINDAELVNLGDQNPRFIRNSANSTPERQLSRRTIEACPDVVTESMDDKELTFGAGALRLKSRIAFSRKEGDFRTMLLNNARALNRVDANGGRNVIHYWVVASSNGGTGSGTVHDVLYMVNMVHRSQIHDSDQKVGLVLFMPRFYINVNQSNERYPRNAYAVFSELSALQGGAKSRSMNKLFHRLAMIDEYNLFNPNTAYRPFQFCIPVDYQTADNNNMGSQDNMYSNAAEMLYYIHSGAGAGGFDSFVNNYEDGEKVWPSDCFLIPMGYRAIRKPNDEFDNYMSLRIKYEFLRYGIIGEGVEDSSVRKEAARVLFDSVIKKMLFSGGDPESYFSKVAARAAEKLEEEMPQNMILNSKGKVVSQLPQTVGIESTRSLITDIKAMMARMEPEKKQTRKLLESKLWCWVEDTARTWGLKYVLDILLEVDAMCTDIYQSYNTDTRMENLVGIGNSRSSLIANRDGIEKELDDLRNKAMHVSVSEFLGGNGDDVKAFYDRLVDWVKARGLGFFSNSVEENLLVIRYEALTNPAMEQLFAQKRKSPYRNYVHSPADLSKDILYLLILDRTEVIEEKRALLEATGSTLIMEPTDLRTPILIMRSTTDRDLQSCYLEQGIMTVSGREFEALDERSVRISIPIYADVDRLIRATAMLDHNL